MPRLTTASILLFSSKILKVLYLQLYLLHLFPLCLQSLQSTERILRTSAGRANRREITVAPSSSSSDVFITITPLPLGTNSANTCDAHKHNDDWFVSSKIKGTILPERSDKKLIWRCGEWLPPSVGRASRSVAELIDNHVLAHLFALLACLCITEIDRIRRRIEVLTVDS